jgi:hypothetical protein
MTPDLNQKIYRYRRVEQAKMFIDRYYSELINLKVIPDEDDLLLFVLVVWFILLFVF